MILNGTPHKRYNPLSGEWILVSPHRTRRPWQGQEEESHTEQRSGYDPECYLCPGNKRAGGKTNPQYEQTFIFTNDFSALLPEPEKKTFQNGLLRAESESGLCKVLCFSPRHDLNFARLDTEALDHVIQSWKAEYQALGSMENIRYVQIFENHGAIMGCSNPHPHGQIWAQESVPPLVKTEDKTQADFYEKNKKKLLAQYLEEEKRIQADQNRIVTENDFFTALVPFWAVWPFEILILPRTELKSLREINREQEKALAGIMQKVTIKYDNLFKTDFPYSMGIHQAPTDNRDNAHWTFHVHYYPPLLRSATVKKFMVGYEMMAMPQRDITAESAAEILRKLPDIHYTEKEK